MARHFLYFAYGSNLLSHRLRQRTASAVAIGCGVLPGHVLRWHMASTDGSGKCDVLLQGDGVAAVHGVVYRIDHDEKPLLDKAESLGSGYREEQVVVNMGAQQVVASIYRALRIDDAAVPYDWYHALVLAGAREQQLPEPYLRQLAGVTTRADPDAHRAALHFALAGGAVPAAGVAAKTPRLIDIPGHQSAQTNRAAQPRVLAVHASAKHDFSKTTMAQLRLVQGLGVEGDAHCGVNVQHRSRVARDPSQPNLRQVHLLQGELLDELHRKGFLVAPGDLGENITTLGIDLLSFVTGTCLSLGNDAVIELTGLRNPCVQIDQFRSGLMAAVLDRAPDGTLIRKAGVMAVVLRDGVVHAHDRIVVQNPNRAGLPLQPV